MCEVHLELLNDYLKCQYLISHPAESSENTAICAKIRKYILIECIWRKLSQPHFHEELVKIHGKSEELQII